METSNADECTTVIVINKQMQTTVHHQGRIDSTCEPYQSSHELHVNQIRYYCIEKQISMHFGHSFIRQEHFGCLKITFENRFQS